MYVEPAYPQNPVAVKPIIKLMYLLYPHEDIDPTLSELFFNSGIIFFFHKIAFQWFVKKNAFNVFNAALS